ncbi:hypothetical protein FJTKL_08763 [Diaporthe vaccinii]|uniref:ABC transporter n=1 Tax=Diaporthe vaccinii TaxID=105482 RepID=A0ABR4EQG6_9PEZI
MLFCFGVVTFTGSKVPRYQNTWFEAVEARVNLTSHTLSSFNSVKLLGLSGKMEARIQDKRREEMKLSQNFRFNNCIALTFSLLPLVLSPLLTFVTFAALGTTSQESTFSVSKAVTSLSILNLMNTPARRLLFSIPYGLQALGSFSRIQKFLLLDEHIESSKTDVLSSREAEKSNPEQKSDLESSKAAFDIKDAEFGWDASGSPLVSLGNMTLAKGSFTAITGPIGCGKSTLLKGLLSETIFMQGSVQVSAAHIAYCSQTPWIYEGTIRDNIVGESEFDSVWYNTVLSSCELDSDLGRMPAGDATMVGSMGSGVSGGQRQRISIARALYAKKDLAIFDDVTNALDARTLRAVTEKVFGTNRLLRSRGSTVVLTTHSVQILKAADQVLLMGSKGGILDCGTYEEVSKQLMGIGDAPAEIPPEADVPTGNIANIGEYQVQFEERMTDLQRQTGDWRSYILYIQSLGWLNFFVFVFGAVTYALSIAFFQIWVTWWSGDETGRHLLGYWLGIYVVWGVLIMLALLITPMGYIYYMVPKSSVILHQNLLAAAMRAPMSFISNIDTGSLVNRFSQDIRLCDWQLPIALIVTLFEFLSVVASIGIAVSAIAWIAIGIPVMVAVLFFLQRFYLRTSRQLRLLEIEARAPLVSSFIETIQGITSILTIRPEGDLPLKGVTFSIKPGEHVAVCGRTGSGKSSLVAALLRRLERRDGTISISGVDVSTLDPELVRSRLNLITQEPFLFQGTVRENAVPWDNAISDNSIIEVLSRLNLWDKIESLGGLDGTLEEHSLSHGQRQLFCLARALLRETKIVILDEPTSQIDSDTDAMIQRVIREDLQGRTVIMISHRLKSVVDLDRVLMLDSGRLIEDGSPKDLLSDAGSAFKALCDASQVRL